MGNLKTKIDFKKPTKDAYDAPQISHIISDEAGQLAMPLPDDYVVWGSKIGMMDGSDKIKELRFTKTSVKKSR